jgi:hypothetical protein
MAQNDAEPASGNACAVVRPEGKPDMRSRKAHDSIRLRVCFARLLALARVKTAGP